MKKLLIYILIFLGNINIVLGLPLEKEGLIIHSQILNREVPYSIVLPEGYDTSKKEYSVLYLFHGIGGDHSSWLEYGNVARVMDKMIQDRTIQPFIIVIPEGYLSYYSDAYDGSFSYEQFFIREFVPYIDKNYRTLKNISSRSIGGFSMGGFGALTVSLRNRDLFGSVVALSSSIRTEEQYCEEGPQKSWDEQWGRIFGGIGQYGPQRLTTYYKERSPYHILSKIQPEELDGFEIMLDIGDKEGTLCESNEALHRLLLQKGILHEWEVRAGGHDFACWNAALPKAFSFVNRQFSKNNKTERDRSVKNKFQDEASIRTLRTATVYYPEQQKESARKYPVIYIQGNNKSIQEKAFAGQFHEMVRNNETWPAILCFVNEKSDLAEAITDVEQQIPEIRASQRMRALICIGESAENSLKVIQKENLFTGIVWCNAKSGEEKANTFAEAISSHKRFPRCWIEVYPDFEAYNFSSNLHILLQKSGMDHEFRARKCSKDNILSCWKEWIIYLTNRIHV